MNIVINPIHGNSSSRGQTDMRMHHNVVRVHHAARTMLAIPAFMSGKDTVRESLADKLIAGYFRKVLLEEIIPTLDCNREEKQYCARAVLERFRHLHTPHQLLIIAADAVPNFRRQLLPVLRRYREMNGSLPPGLTCSLAALVAFYRGHCNGNSSLVGWRGGKHYIVQVDPRIREFFAEVHDQCRHDGIIICSTILGNTDIWGSDLNAIPLLTTLVTRQYLTIRHHDMRGALEQVLATTRERLADSTEAVQ